MVTIKINFSNKWLYTFIMIGIIVAVGIGVNAFGGNNPEVMGHSINELAPPEDCYVGQFLAWTGTNWICSEPTETIEEYTYSWITSVWSACNDICAGSQTRTVQCRRSDDLIVIDSLCLDTVGVAPVSIQACGDLLCTGKPCSECPHGFTDNGDFEHCNLITGGQEGRWIYDGTVPAPTTWSEWSEGTTAVTCGFRGMALYKWEIRSLA